ncbi:CASP-like protein [Melia azedarach]|uniref:CASP-like protein n=1 Tax=Melia azedarach TaxID=155640 RepID=A0ACC1YEM2_MELAZ|nr:CASP-like protein [Melia azedarach]
MAHSDKPAATSPYELPPTPSRVNYSPIDATLRFLLFSASVVSVVLMVTSKQSQLVPVPGLPFAVTIPAKFNHSPAFIYFIAALSVAGLYSIITILASLSSISKAASSKTSLLLFAFGDVVMLGIVASATGASGAVGYIGLKGNDHSGWAKICDVYGKFCRHIGSATGVGLFAAVVLVFLSMLSTYSLYKRIRD